MKSAILVAGLLFFVGASLPHAQAQPSIAAGTVVNAASRIPKGLPNYGIAQGSLFTLTGQGLVTAATPITVADSPLPLTLAGASMQITVGGTKVDVPMVSAWAGFAQIQGARVDQLAGVAPSNTPVGDGTITVTVNGRTSAPAPITIVPAAFGIFTLNHAGVGPGIFTGADLAFSSLANASHLIGPFFPDTSYGGNTLVATAHAGDQLVIWGTGLGAISGDDTAPPATGSLDVPVEVHVGNLVADVASQGRAPFGAGVDQIVFTAPDGVQGCYVPVAVTIGGVVSNFATISISTDGNVCSDAIGWSLSDLQGAANAASIKVGDISLTKLNGSFSVPGLGSVQGVLDFGNAGFARRTGQPLGVLAALNGTSGGLVIPSSGCLVLPFQTGSGLFDNFLPSENDLPFGEAAVPFQFLDAGSGINITGPAGVKQLPKFLGRGITDEYKVQGSAIGGGIPPLIPLSPEFLAPGTYTVDNGSGGTDVKGFSASLAFSNNHATWTGQEAIGDIDRTQGLTITWSGSGSVLILGNAANTAAAIGAQFTCTAGDADNGSFTVPARVMSALPASGIATDIPAPVGFLGVGSLSSTRTRLQVTGIDAGYFSWGAFQLKNVNFK
jgi:uncharacterized protein (TIGR03437 family)